MKHLTTVLFALVPMLMACSPTPGRGESKVVGFCREEGSVAHTRTLNRLYDAGWSYVGPLHNDGINCTNVLFRRVPTEATAAEDARQIAAERSELAALRAQQDAEQRATEAARASEVDRADRAGCGYPCDGPGCEQIRARCSAMGLTMPAGRR